MGTSSAEAAAAQIRIFAILNRISGPTGKRRSGMPAAPAQRDYTLLANATAEYLQRFELTHERVQNRAGKTTERRRAENVR